MYLLACYVEKDTEKYPLELGNCLLIKRGTLEAVCMHTWRSSHVLASKDYNNYYNYSITFRYN